MMNAIEFVKKFGLVEAKKQLEDPKLVYFAQVDYQFMHDLKQIVEASNLVEYCNGLENAKELLEEIDSERWVYNLYTNNVISSDYSPCDNMCIKYDVLKQAIELVEMVL